MNSDAPSTGLSDRMLETVARVTRPARRRLTPSRFKETYVNRALAGREHRTTYVEIGVRDGEAFRLAKADRRIGIDPKRSPMLAALRPGEWFFETTSDEFFDRHVVEVLEPGNVDVALVDGLHEFRQALRDVTNLETLMRRDGVIILDDCNPRTPQRGSESPTGGAWNGDVWKVQAFLLTERPDLAVATIDADEGVGVITGFGQARPTYDQAAIERFKSLSYRDLAADRKGSLNLLPSASFDALLP